ncbi:uncharacterized protein LOC120441318 [Oreochromis aureus]|uniref:uncharacterized protein LOC120441318 n=1 Tax=Oreochromis aureus TaxID=47969 RepID=UPI0019539D4D|nr:uncharacterized protein LOC120441318 [Oreochromis aureus]
MEHETKTEPRNIQKQSKTKDAGVQGNSVHGEQKADPGGDSTKVHSPAVPGAGHVRSGSRTGPEAGRVEDCGGSRTGPEAGRVEDGGGCRAGPEAGRVEDGGGSQASGVLVEAWWAQDQTRVKLKQRLDQATAQAEQRPELDQREEMQSQQVRRPLAQRTPTVAAQGTQSAWDATAGAVRGKQSVQNVSAPRGLQLARPALQSRNWIPIAVRDGDGENAAFS